MPKISVIMGIYNVGDTLEEAINSLLDQTFQDFEIVMCDDGSTDNTLEIAKRYKKMYPNKIILLKNKRNLGLNYTLNHCLRYAKGEYIARMDGDDICNNRRFEKQAAFLDKHPDFSIVSSVMTLYDEKGDFRTISLKKFPGKTDCIKTNPYCHAAVMIRSEAYHFVGGYTVDKRMLRVEDVDLWIKLTTAGYKGYNFQEPLYKMRDDREAVSRRKFKYRINSSYVRILGCKKLKLPIWYYYYALVPVMIGLLPDPIYNLLHRLRNR